MPSILLLLQTVHDIVHDLPMKPNYTEPKIYTGGIEIKQWSKLSKSVKDDALSKEWYVYYSFRNPETGKLVRQPNSKTGIKRIKDGLERFEKLKLIQETILFLLRKGFNPYLDNTPLEKSLIKDSIISSPLSEIQVKKEIEIIPETKTQIQVKKEKTIRESFEFGLKIKIKVLGKTSYNGYQGRIKKFLVWLEGSDTKSNVGISMLSKKVVINYLNDVLEKTSASNRNNTRTDLSSLIQTLVDNEIIVDNFIKSINVLKSAPERNKTYSVNQESEILKHLGENDPILLLFIQFISYNYLRPVEVCRLKIGDLDIEGKKLFVRAKNKAVKVKIIPQKIIDLLPELHSKNPDHYLFTPTEIGAEWHTEENNRRDYFSKRFKITKDHFKLGLDYGLYSFRHTSITNLYKELNKTLTPFETKSRLMQITGHQTMEALDKYLRDIDAALPEDYSHLLK
jgi:integrase